MQVGPHHSSDLPPAKRIKTGEDNQASSPPTTMTSSDTTSNNPQQDGMATLDAVLAERLELQRILEAQVNELNDRDTQYSKGTSNILILSNN